MNKIYFVIGSSGGGKTTAVKSIQEINPDSFQYCYFDSIGVPSPEEMIKKFGSGDNWQKTNTNYWVKKMKEESLNTKPAILDGQTRPLFIDEACKEHGITLYDVILFDCTDGVRKQRLVDRGHPELANDQMMNWAKYLREESLSRKYKVIDTTNLTKEESRDALFNLINEKES